MLPLIVGLRPYKAVQHRDLVLDEENRSHSPYNHVLYFAREGGAIAAFIKCGSGFTSAPGGINTCEHHFVLWPEMDAQVQLSYAAGLLPHWREYQSRFRDFLLGLRVDRPASTSIVKR
jgi:hypothetical protein